MLGEGPRPAETAAMTAKARRMNKVITKASTSRRSWTLNKVMNLHEPDGILRSIVLISSHNHQTAHIRWVPWYEFKTILLPYPQWLIQDEDILGQKQNIRAILLLPSWEDQLFAPYQLSLRLVWEFLSWVFKRWNQPFRDNTDGQIHKLYLKLKTGNSQDKDPSFSWVLSLRWLSLNLCDA